MKHGMHYIKHLFGIGLTYIARTVGWIFGAIAIACAVLAWVVAMPFAALGILLMEETVHVNYAGLEEMVTDIWEQFN